MVPVPDDAGGVILDDRIVWRALPYFESARGHTKVSLEERSTEGGSDEWGLVIAKDVYVLPSKIGEDRYHDMAIALEQISRSLLADLYGKSTKTHDLRLAKEGRVLHSREEELQAIASVLDRLGPVLRSIAQRPASRMEATMTRKEYWGGTRLAPTSLAWLCRRGQSISTAERPVLVMALQKSESFDVPEHRVIKAFLELLIRRALHCSHVAMSHITALQSERHLRHIKLGSGPTIYESVDVPRIRRLQEAATRAEQSVMLAKAMSDLPFLRGVTPKLIAVHEGTFQRNAEYLAVEFLIRRFLLKNSLLYEGDELSAVTKLTSRLFEQWCYLSIVEAFRLCGLELQEWSDALRQNLRTQFILDFDRGLAFEGEISADLRLRFRYEPWVLSQESAAKKSETLYRGPSSDVAWCPDIVIECLVREGDDWRTVYGIVLDCKYTAAVKSHHWNDTTKYLEIRSSKTKRQVVRQLWLIVPGLRPSIGSEDPAITFDGSGPSCEPDESVRFLLSVIPEAKSKPIPFHEFAVGTIAYLRNQFGTSNKRDPV
jgi:hypothetical protein